MNKNEYYYFSYEKGVLILSKEYGHHDDRKVCGIVPELCFNITEITIIEDVYDP